MKYPKTALVKSIFSILLLFGTSLSFAQKNITYVDSLHYSNVLSDVWGYVDTAGREYALVGVYNGVSIVDVDTPTSIKELFFIPGPPSIWRDMMTWGTYAYATNEKDSGMLIIDLAYLPDSISFSWWADTLGLSSAHNLWIDENGFCYLFGSNLVAGEGAIILDLNSNPLNPEYVGAYGNYIHDGFVRGDTLWGGEVYNGWFSAVDVSDKANPSILATHATPHSFTHNCWLSDNGNTLFTTDEKPGAFIASYDVSDLGNIQELDRYQSIHDIHYDVIPHNTHYLNDYLITSYYTDGVTIVDAKYPDNLIEIGFYDTSPISGSSFNGDWGVYPFLPSGILLVSDIEEGLHILSPQYIRACYLEGTITDSVTSAPINNVLLEIISTTANETSNLLGQYKTGWADAGTFDVRFSKSGFITKTISGVVLQNDSITYLDVVLFGLPKTTLTGQVLMADDLSPVESGNVLITSDLCTLYATTDMGGNFTINNVYYDTYNLHAAVWGTKTGSLTNKSVDDLTNDFTILLSNGIYDDFTFDLGWTTAGTTYLGGLWERADPDSTNFPGTPLFNPGDDVPDDISNQCYVTGNGGPYDFLIDGVVVLTSPKFDLSGYEKPYLSCSTWFANYDSSDILANDSMLIKMTNGIDEVVIARIGADTTQMSQWISRFIKLTGLLPSTPDMQLIFEVSADMSLKQLCEAGVDMVAIIDSAKIGIANNSDQGGNITVSISPNPFNDYTIITIHNLSNTQHEMIQQLDLAIYDLLGRNVMHITNESIVRNTEISGSGMQVEISRENLAQGLYFFNLTLDKEIVAAGKFEILD